MWSSVFKDYWIQTCNNSINPTIVREMKLLLGTVCLAVLLMSMLSIDVTSASPMQVVSIFYLKFVLLGEKCF